MRNPLPAYVISNSEVTRDEVLREPAARRVASKIGGDPLPKLKYRVRELLPVLVERLVPG
jgi:hypothetical protein